MSSFPLTDPELILKASAPRVGRHLRTRARLSSSNSLSTGRRVVLLQAPGGFGKTSLLSQWRREWMARGARVAWLALDGGDEGLRFLNGLYAAMAVADETQRMPWPQRGQNDDVIRGLTAWLAEVSASGGDWVLVLDDAHRLPVGTAQGALAYVIANAPPNLTLAIAARTSLRLPLAASRAYGRAVQLGPEQLRLEPQESQELLRARFGNRVDAEACARMHELTEGWPLGLQLLIATLERKPDVKKAVLQLKSSERVTIEQDLLQGLLEQLGSDAQNFLLQIAIVDRVDCRLAEALTGRADAGPLLEQLLATTPIFAESDVGHWLRIHPLMRSHLKAELERMPAQRLREQHMRAATLLEERGMHHEAAVHALAAGEPAWAYDLAERFLYEMAYAGHFALVLGWVERIPPAEVQRRPRLLLATAWALAVGSRTAEAAALVQPLYEAADSAPESRAEAACIIASASHHADAHASSFNTIKPWLKAGDIGVARIDGVLGLHRAGAHLYRGRPAMARYELTRMRYVGETDRLDSVTGWIEFFGGFSYVWEGRVSAAEEPLYHALARAEADIGRRSLIATMLASMLAMSLWEQDRGAMANELLAHRLDLVEHCSNVDSIIMGLLVASRMADLQGAKDRSTDLLESMFALGQARGVRRLGIEALRELITRQARARRGGSCARLLLRMQALGPLPEDMSESWSNLPWLIGHAHATLALAQHAEAARHLEEAAALAKHLCRGRDLVEIQLLQVLMLYREGRRFDEPLREALGMARELGLRRIAADTHPDLAAIARDALPETPEWPDAPTLTWRQQESDQAGGGLLTGKEREVLELLSRKMTNRQIASGLSVGEETIKWHLKNLFAKLGAGTRRHAVERARLLGILPNSGEATGAQGA